MARKRKKQPAATTAQKLTALIKSSRDIMRKDKGLSGDLDRLPLLTWIMFLKFLDDMEQLEESRAKLAGRRYRESIDPPYRWRDWAADEEGITGPELLTFINQEQAIRPDGSLGAGLITHLRTLNDGNGHVSRRRVIATVFSGVVNRMASGYLLRDVINKIGAIHFLSREEMFTLGHLYESMLKEMRDAAGDNGEFYTPRPLVRFMVDVINPTLGETILDPACGTGGFLVESYNHLIKQVQTVEQRQALQNGAVLGGEAKPLPYLLCQMNLLLHGIEHPAVSPDNSLAVKITELGDKDRVDVILTNPPFGGAEERGILSNFPQDKQTTETALLFLQLIMRKLRRGSIPGRAAVVIPNGPLFADGVAMRVKQELLQEFNLHTVLRLPNGVFAPYTPIPTNVLFFDRNGPTTDVWFYTLPLPQGRKTYTKTKPLRYEEFDPVRRWWSRRDVNEHAWKVSHEEIRQSGYNLERSHPSTYETSDLERPEVLVKRLEEKEQQIKTVLECLTKDLELHP